MTTQDKVIKTKLGLLRLATHLNNVSQACRTMGYSRDSYYRIKELYEKPTAIISQNQILAFEELVD